MDESPVITILGIVRDAEEAGFLTGLVEHSDFGTPVRCLAVTSFVEGLILLERRRFFAVAVRFSIEDGCIFDFQFPNADDSYRIVLVDREEKIDPARLADDRVEAVCTFENTEEFRHGFDFYVRKAIVLHSGNEGSIPYLERRYENLVQALPDVVYELDLNGNFTFISSSIRTFGYEPDQLIGQHFSTILFPEDVAVVNRDTVLRTIRSSKNVVRLAPKLFNERRGIDRKTENLELRIKRQPSRANPEKEAIATIISYGEVASAGSYRFEVDDEEKVFVGSVGIIRDITLRRKSEDMLRRMYQAVDQSAIGVAILDNHRVVTYANPYFLRITGYAPPELIGMDIALFEMSAGGTRIDSEAMRDAEGGLEWQGEVQLKKASGDAFWCRAQISPVKSPSGLLTHYLFIVEDITEKKRVEFLLKQAKDQAEEASRQKNLFLANMSHEIRTPLNGIVSMTELLLPELTDEGQKRRLEMIKESADTLSAMLNDVLEYSELEDGRITVKHVDIELETLFENGVRSHRPKAEEKGLEFSLSVHGNPSRIVRVDADHAARVISILTDNAIKFTDRGRVSVSGELSETATGSRLHGTVRDSGVGIPKENRYLLFKSFSQGDSTFAKRHKGIGLGLVIAKEIVEKMGGELWFRSEEGKGSVFEFMIPIEAAAMEQPAENLSVAKADRSLAILVADDNEVNREYIAFVLQSAGHSIGLAENGHEVLTQLENQRFDLILMDVQMPGMDGVETARRIRSYSGALYDPKIPIIAFTAYSAEDISSNIQVFDGFMQKPIKVSALLELLNTVMSK